MPVASAFHLWWFGMWRRCILIWQLVKSMVPRIFWQSMNRSRIVWHLVPQSSLAVCTFSPSTASLNGWTQQPLLPWNHPSSCKTEGDSVYHTPKHHLLKPTSGQSVFGSLKTIYTHEVNLREKSTRARSTHARSTLMKSTLTKSTRTRSTRTRSTRTRSTVQEVNSTKSTLTRSTLTRSTLMRSTSQNQLSLYSSVQDQRNQLFDVTPSIMWAWYILTSYY